MTTKKYNVWLVIEEVTIHDKDDETYQDLDDLQRKAGSCDTLEKATELVESLSIF